MEKEKNNKGLIILVIMLVLIILGLIGFIVYDKVLSNKEEVKQNKTSNITEKITTSQNVVVEDKSTIKQKTLEECNYNDCNIYSSNVVSVDLKNIVKKDYLITGDVYINNKLSTSVEFPNAFYNVGGYIDIETNQSKYLLMRFSNEGALYTDFYLYNFNGKLITNFEEENKEYQGDYGFITFKNNELNILIIKGIVSDDMTLKEEYCELKAKPNDIYTITKKANIIDNKIKIYETNNTTWEEEYKCTDEKNTNGEDCGDISKVICEQ